MRPWAPANDALKRSRKRLLRMKARGREGERAGDGLSEEVTRKDATNPLVLSPSPTLVLSVRVVHTLDLADEIRGDPLGVTEQHDRIVAIEQRVVDAGEAGRHASLHDHGRPRIPGLEHRHSIDGR